MVTKLSWGFQSEDIINSIHHEPNHYVTFSGWLCSRLHFLLLFDPIYSRRKFFFRFLERFLFMVKDFLWPLWSYHHYTSSLCFSSKPIFFSRKTQITISVFFSMPSHDIRKKKSLLIPSSGLSYFYWFLVNLAFQTSPLNWRNECVDDRLKWNPSLFPFLNRFDSTSSHNPHLNKTPWTTRPESTRDMSRS